LRLEAERERPIHSRGQEAAAARGDPPPPLPTGPPAEARRQYGRRLDCLDPTIQARLDQAVHQMLDEVGVPPFRKLVPRSRRKLRLGREELAERSRGRVALSELAVGRGESEVHAPESGHLDLSGDVPRPR
jgi:hypothetical protein